MTKLKFKVTSAVMMQFLCIFIFYLILDSTDVHGNRYIKVFHLSMDFEGNWMDSRSFCKTFDMDLATFDSSYEFSNFVKMAWNKRDYFMRWTHIGGISKFTEKHREWYWINTNSKVTYSMQFAVGQVSVASFTFA